MQEKVKLAQIVSIHASSREDATRITHRSNSRTTSFNPRVLAGGRDPEDFHHETTHYVSIHASSREDATPECIIFITLERFQSTRPRGRTRRWRFCPAYWTWSFNPRVLAGGRDCSAKPCLHRDKFQSTRPRGRTRRSIASALFAGSVSIHASSREDATSGIQRDKNFVVFQSTRPRGRTRLSASCFIRVVHLVSIHASSREDATCRK